MGDIVTVKQQIHLAALQHNLQQVRLLAPKSRVLAMVKANAYGHGLPEVVRALHEVDAFGVARLQEAIECRKINATKPIVLMAGIFSVTDLELVDQLHCDLVVHEPWQVEALKQFKPKQPIRIWLKINTGMNRLGLMPEQVPAIYHQLQNMSSVAKPLILMTHFASSSEPRLMSTQQQFNLFKQTISGLEGETSCANSAAILAFPETHGDWVRPGIMLYGSSPFTGLTGAQHHLQPVMRITSKIIAIHQLKVGDRVGYSGIWQAEENMPVGVVAMGYGDGYPRHAANGTPVFIRGKVCPLVGRVSMDMITIDLRNCPDAKLEDEVVLWGAELPVEQVAQAAQTISYELLTRLSPRQASKLII